MKSTMQDAQLTIGSVLRHGTTVHADSEVVTATPDGTRSRTYADVGRRAAQLAHGLRGLGIDADQRVATFMWNNAEHLEAYLAVPSMGAVLHTLNIRLFPEQLVYIANHADDRVVLVDDSLVPLLAKELPQLETVTHVLVAGPDAASADLDSLRASGKEVLLYEDLLSGQPETFEWPEIDERDAAAMCYTSGTTGNPKGVVYSHRSAWLHSQAVSTGNAAGLDFHDRVLPIVPMFHANSWGLAYAAIMTGASLCMPDRWLQAEPLVRFIQDSRPTVSGAVPTVWNDVLSYLDGHDGVRLDSLRLILCGGSAVPVSLQQGLEERHNLHIRQAWGMTETSPVASAGLVPVGVEGDAQWVYRGSQGRLLCGVEGRIVGDDGASLPWDGTSVGELEVRGPWVTGGYYEPDDADDAAEKFHDGWLRTGDVGTPRRARLHHAQRPGQGRDQVRRRVDLLGRPRERPDGSPRRGRGGRRRHPRREVAGAPAGHDRGARGSHRDARGPPRAPRRLLRQVAAPRRLGVRRPGAAHLGREVRQEGRAAGLRRGPLRRTPDHRLTG